MNSKKSTQLVSTTDHFSVLLSPTPRGARLARLLATDWMRDRDLPHRVAEAAEHLVAELAANAATHGRLAGRDFRLALLDRGATLRIEVTDTRGDDLPLCRVPAPDAESGRGLLLVEALADRWGVRLGPVPRKTVWAELDLPPA
ncbi:ATP-binding protein [Streptomyces sp. NPDC004051]